MDKPENFHIYEYEINKDHWVEPVKSNLNRIKCTTCEVERVINKSHIQNAFTMLGVNDCKHKMPANFKALNFELNVNEHYLGK